MNKCARFSSLAFLMIFILMTACAQSGGKFSIPDNYKSRVVVYCFENLWSEQEDGSDLAGSAEFTADTEECEEILAFLTDLTLSKTDNSGNFMPDFSFYADGEANGYDFVFTADDRLILRDPKGDCSQVNISVSNYSDLKGYIGEIRLANTAGLPGGFGADREPTDEDLAVFEEAMEELVGVSYAPTLVATQVVAGVNYRFTATATPVVPNAESYEVYIYIFKPLEGKPELGDIVRI